MLMKGLKLSQAFFEEFGKPFIREEFPQLFKRLAAGRIGGSDTIGADDIYSRDHCWGAWFQIWLTNDDYRRYGNRLQTSFQKAAPAKFKGHPFYTFAGEKPGTIELSTIDDLFISYTGWKQPPDNLKDWFLPIKRSGLHSGSLIEREGWLYFIKHSTIFYDPLGELMERIKAFSRYPNDVRDYRIAQLCSNAWYVGEAKFCQRWIYRKDPVTIHTALGAFVVMVMQICFLINNDYTPHWHWLHHEFLKLPEARQLEPMIEKLLRLHDTRKQSKIIYEIGHVLRKQLVKKGYMDTTEPVERWAQDYLKKRIKDKWIQGMI